MPTSARSISSRAIPLSAASSSRDAEYQGIMPVRGKILNCLKADYARIFKSEIITDLIKVLGCGVEVEKHGKELNNFSLENLRWNKVVICTDADVDGYQIRTLILTMLWRLVPTLIREGYVYIAESPLYEIQAKGRRGSRTPTGKRRRSWSPSAMRRSSSTAAKVSARTIRR